MVWIIVIAAYMLLLGLLALAIPGIGPLGTLLAFIPGDWRDHAHLPAYGLLAYLMMLGLRRSNWSLSSAIPLGLVTTFLFGLYTELLQYHAPGRSASAADLLTDTAGAALAGSLLLIQTRTVVFSRIPFSLVPRLTTAFQLRARKGKGMR
jgi:hypothetical protein